MILYEIEKFVIVLVALLMAYAEFAQVKLHKRAWVKWGLGFMGIYWAVYYTYSLIRTMFGLLLEGHQIFVRSGLLLTLSLVTSNAILNWKALRRAKHDR